MEWVFSSEVLTRRCLVFLIPLVAACVGDAAQRADPAVIRDSAGVRIVENTTPRWGEGDAWSLSVEPVVDIGMTEGDANYELFRVRGAVRLSDGTIVVANRGSNDLRFFDGQGRYLLTAGRQGGGPGEFGWVGGIFRMSGDSIGVDSGNPPRFQVFDANGRFIRSVPRDRGTVQGVFSDGSILVEELTLDSIPGIERFLRPNVRLVRIDADRQARDTLGSFPGTQALYQQYSEGFRMAASRDFLLFTSFAVKDDQLLVADNAEYRVDIRDAGGGWHSSVRQPGWLVPLGDEVLETWFRSLPSGDDEAYVSRRVAGVRRRPSLKTVPAFENILVDDDGNLWVQEYPLQFGDPQRWTVFARNGELLGTMEMPPSFQPYHVGSDFVLGRFQDESDVEHVRLYALIKPGQ